MGQYHYVVNFDRKEYLHPHAFGDGLKLLEFGCSACGTLTGLALLLAGSNGRGGGDAPVPDAEPNVIGRWAGDRIAIVGDYHEADDVRGQVLPKGFYHTLAGEEDGWVDISPVVVRTIELDRYIKDDRKDRWSAGGHDAVPAYDPATDRFTSTQTHGAPDDE